MEQQVEAYEKIKQHTKDLLDKQGAGEFDSPDKVEQFFDIWGIASTTYDKDALDRLINDGYQFIGPDGNAWGKNEMIGSVLGGHPDFESFESSEWEILPLAENVALKRSVITVKGELHGRDISGKYRLSNLFVRDDKGWRLSNCHLTGVCFNDPE